MMLVAPTAFKGTMSPLEAARHLTAPGDRLLPLWVAPCRPRVSLPTAASSTTRPW